MVIVNYLKWNCTRFRGVVYHRARIWSLQFYNVTWHRSALYCRFEINVCILVVENLQFLEKYLWILETNILNEVAEHLFTQHTNGNFT